MAIYENPFTTDTSRIPINRILDRSDELKRIETITVARSENILLTGENGIGKTCLLKKFRSALSTQYPDDCLLVEIEMLGMATTPDRFISGLLLKLFEVVYTSVTNKPFSSLLAYSSTARDFPVSLVPAVKHIIQLFRMVKARETSSNVEDKHKIGASLGLSANKEEKLGKSYKSGELSPTELLSISYELLVLLNDKGFSRVIVFGDEANHISPDIEIDLYRSNFEAFSSRNLQFVFTGAPRLFEKIPHFHELFPNALKVTGFKDTAALDELIDINCKELAEYGISLNFPSEIRTIIWNITSGNPQEIQRICRTVTDIAVEESLSVVTTELIIKGCLDVYSFIPKKLSTL